MIDQDRTQSLFRKLDRLLSKTGAAPTVERVHQVRTTARRLEGVLQVVYPKPAGRVAKLARGLKKLRRCAGAVRDLDVQAAALRQLKIGREPERKARLLDHLAEERAAREAKFQKLVHGEKIGKLRKRLRQTAQEIAHTAAAPDGSTPPPAWTGFDPFAASLRMFSRVVRQTKTLTPDNLHGYRTSCKRVRYVAEMSPAPEARRIVRALKRTQDAIGEWHDWLTLTATAEDLFPNARESALVSALRNIRNAKFSEARTVALDVRRELMREYRAMLQRERAIREAAQLAPGTSASQSSRRTRTSERRKSPASAPHVTAVANVA